VGQALPPARQGLVPESTPAPTPGALPVAPALPGEAIANLPGVDSIGSVDRALRIFTKSSDCGARLNRIAASGWHEDTGSNDLGHDTLGRALYGPNAPDNVGQEFSGQLRRGTRVRDQMMEAE
jgi:hypothetical protein